MTKSHPKHKNLPPVTATITGLSHEGRAITSVNGKITFLFGGLPGETVKFVYLKKHGQYDEGQVVEVLQSSPDRIPPVCAHFGDCGGCRLQHFAHHGQLAAKQQLFLDQLAHIGGTKPHRVLPALTSPTTGYRYKARLGVKFVRAKNKVLVGFHEINGRYLVDMQSCAVLHPAVGQKITHLSALVQSLDAQQTIAQIEVAISDEVVALIFRHLQPLSSGDLYKLTQFARQESLTIYLQPGGINTIHRLWPEGGSDLLSYRLPAYNVEILFHPSDFTQVNPEINRQMVSQALTLLNPQPHERILDLFCGLGNFTLPLARHCQSVTGIEGALSLVERARHNASHNQITNAQFFASDLTQDLIETQWGQASYDKILLDPPRTGALELVKKLPMLQPRAILYVSCNPATLARDSKELLQQGYQLTIAGIMDMFPHTSHVESMALFEKM
ncbi:MAG TPA: 23S rRNA (uracil(1939)-C(5))-methyltransferase RlmD [Gammaproteobacteria bacterium]|nr:23S rRNA (uracil(1939)-C(5))-methyltransferase RlmD [Gammaproteobacteria bacterium]